MPSSMGLEPSSGSLSSSFTSYSRAFRMMKLTLSKGRSRPDCSGGCRFSLAASGTERGMANPSGNYPRRNARDGREFLNFRWRMNGLRPYGFCAVDLGGPDAYIGGGPRPPNGALSFWKE